MLPEQIKEIDDIMASYQMSTGIKPGIHREVLKDGKTIATFFVQPDKSVVFIDVDNAKPATQKFYQSRTFRSAVVPVVVIVLRYFGCEVPADDIMIVVSLLAMLYYRAQATKIIGG